MKKPFIKSLSFCILSTLVMAGCHVGNSTQSGLNNSFKSSAKLTSGGDLQTVTLGTPAIFHQSGSTVLPLVNSCANIDANDKVRLKQFRSSFNFKKINSVQELLDHMGISGDLQFRAEKGSIELSGAYDQLVKTSKRTIRYTMYGNSEALVELDNSKAVTKKEGSGDEKTCGDSYVAGGVGGIYYEGSIIIEATDEYSKSKIEAALNVNYDDRHPESDVAVKPEDSDEEIDKELKKKTGKFGKIAANLDDLTKEDHNVHFELTMEVVTRGGDPENVYDVFKMTGVNPRSGTPEGFFLADLTPETLPAAVDRLQSYLEDLQKQATTLKTIKTYKEATQGMYLTTQFQATPYADDLKPVEFKRSPQLIKSLSNLSAKYVQLLDLKHLYSNMQAMVSLYKTQIDQAQLTPIVDGSKNAMDDFDLKTSSGSRQYIDLMSKCVVYLTPTEQEQCVTDIEDRIKSINADFASLVTSDWNYGYLIHNAGKVNNVQYGDFLLPLTKQTVPGSLEGVLLSYSRTESSLMTNYKFVPNIIYNGISNGSETSPVTWIFPTLPDYSAAESQAIFVGKIQYAAKKYVAATFNPLKNLEENYLATLLPFLEYADSGDFSALDELGRTGVKAEGVKHPMYLNAFNNVVDLR